MYIQIISGQQLPKPRRSTSTRNVSDPYVEVEIAGLDEDNSKNRTRIISDNGLHPTWNESFNFVVRNPDFAFLRLSVFDSDTLNDDFIGSFTIPLQALAQGIGYSLHI